MTLTNSPQLGYFLEYRLWKDALRLLDYQLEIKKKNKHFDTLSLYYYERIKNGRSKLGKKSYFKKRVANNLFYGLEKEFAIIAYPIPKSNLGLRNYKFLTYPLRIIYYAVGLYLVELSQELLSQYYKKHKNIFSYYGGNLSIDEKDNLLKLNYNSIWYKPHYLGFRKKVRSELNSTNKNKIIIHIDIQNYYDELPVSNLLKLLSSYVKPSILKKYKYDNITINQIGSFFGSLSNDTKGIPQSDNDIISAFIGHLYQGNRIFYVK